MRKLRFKKTAWVNETGNIKMTKSAFNDMVDSIEKMIFN